MINLVKSTIKKTPLSPIFHKLYYQLGLPSQNDIYNQQVIEVMKRYLQEDSICIDVGANRGEIFQEIIAIALNAKHFAFEPIPDAANFLRDKYPNHHIYEVALSNQQGEVEFQHFVNPEKDTMFLFGITPEKIYDFLSNKCQLKVSKIKRMLEDKPEYSRKDFCHSINFYLDSYFIAYP